jgi:predicted  nucleic acid-binding Zn-ribbon protein
VTAPQFEALLGVQDLDIALDQHRHRRTVLPEGQEVATIDTALTALAPRLAAATAVRDEVAGRQDTLEAELTGVQGRIREVNGRLYGGTVSASRELSAMAADVEQMEGRRAGLEDRVLEVMEEREPLDASVADLEGERGRLVDQRADAVQRLAAAEAVVDGEIAALNEQRAAAATSVPAELLGTYERMRGRLDGIGAARLVGSRCSGCHLSLPATELDHLKRAPADEIVFCDSCGRILVRP